MDTVGCLGAGIVGAERRAGRLEAFQAIGIEEVRLEEAAACVEASKGIEKFREKRLTLCGGAPYGG